MKDAATELSSLLDRAEAGEEVIIARAGRPVVRLVPVVSSVVTAPRILGTLRGRGWISDDFDAPLAEDLLPAPDADRGRRD